MSVGRLGSVMFQSFAVSSALVVASVCPSGLKATAHTVLPCAGTVAARAGRAGSVTFQSSKVFWLLAVASVCPSGLKATAHTGPP